MNGMAKKKAKEGNVITAVSQDQVNQSQEKRYGIEAWTGEALFEDVTNRQIIPVSPAIDLGLGGGIREGSFVQMAGDPKSGKTTTAVQFAANCQKEEYGSRPVYYYDVEGRFGTNALDGIEGLDREKLTVYKKGKGWPAEDVVNSVEDVLDAVRNAAVIIDSVSALATRDELEYKFDKSGFRAGVPRIMGLFTSKICQTVPAQRAIVIFINHMIADTSPSRRNKMVDGGRKIRYQCDYIMEIAYTQSWEEQEKQVGQKIHWKIVTSASGGFPNTEIVSYLRYGIGLDWRQEIIEKCAEIPTILDKPASSSWYTLNFLDEEPVKIQGSLKLCQYLTDNDLWDVLQNKYYKELYG